MMPIHWQSQSILLICDSFYFPVYLQTCAEVSWTNEHQQLSICNQWEWNHRTLIIILRGEVSQLNKPPCSSTRLLQNSPPFSLCNSSAFGSCLQYLIIQPSVPLYLILCVLWQKHELLSHPVSYVHKHLPLLDGTNFSSPKTADASIWKKIIFPNTKKKSKFYFSLWLQKSTLWKEKCNQVAKFFR